MTDTTPADNAGRRLELLCEHLAGSDDRCPVCDYELRDLQSMHCPECGAALELRIGSRDLRLGSWLFALLCVALPLGITSMYTIAGIVVVIDETSSIGRIDWQMVGVFGTFAIMSALGATVIWHIIRRRRSMWRLSRPKQRLRALVYVLLGTILPLVMFVLIVLLDLIR